MKKRRIAFKTLGCRLNQYETDAIVSRFDKNNYEIVSFTEQADIYLINTCTVTNQGDQKSRQEINKVKNQKHDPLLVVTGCMVDDAANKFPDRQGIDLFIDNKHKTSAFTIIDSHLKGNPADIESYPADIFAFEPAKKTFHTRSLIKIQDGCNHFCTYCIVPKVRGREKSRPTEDILENIKQVIDFGFKEVVLTGVNIGRYNYEGCNFENLVEKILNLPGEFRVRISSIEPEGFGEKLFDLFSHPKLMPHLHLCLQSGSDKILSKMRRMYDLKEFTGMIEKIRTRYPDFNFTTDIIVGFPGETEEDFNQSVDIVREIGFSHIHTFKYSKRDGTIAAKMEGQIPEKIKSERSKIIREISTKNKLKYMRSLLGKKQTMLVERINDRHIAKGYGEYYVPLELKSKEIETNQFYPVLLNQVMESPNPKIIAGKTN